MSKVNHTIPNKKLPQSYNSLKGKIIVLEGPISVGKSTAGKLLVEDMNKKGYKSKYYPEDVPFGLLQSFLVDNEEFNKRKNQDYRGTNKNLDNFAHGFQVAMFANRFLSFVSAQYDIIKNPDTIVIIDRGYIGDYAFSYLHRNNKNLKGETAINDSGWASINDWIMKYIAKIGKPDIILFLTCDGNTSKTRCMNRNSTGEDSYKELYLQSVTDAHKRVLKMHNHIEVDWSKNRNNKEILKDLRDILIKSNEEE